MIFKNNSNSANKLILASVPLLAGFAVPAQAIDIVYSGTSQTADQAVISLIEGSFSDVNINYGDFSDYTTNAAVIEAADLFIVGRRLSSSAYANETNSASFNALSVPVVAFTSYVTRPLDGRWGWHEGDVAANLSVAGDETTVTAAGALAFGVAGGTYDWFPEIGDFNAAGTGVVGDGEILATIGGNILAAHWDAGDQSGTGATFGSERFLFNLTEINDGGTVTTLPNAAGQQALLSALEAYTPLMPTVANQWNVDGGSSFNVAANWSDNVVPTQNPLFGVALSAANAPATVTLDSPVSLNSVTFQSPSQYILAGPEALTLTGDREISAGAGTHQITADIASTTGLVKSGAGTLLLEGAKSYTGTTDVQGGTLLLNNLDAIDNQASGSVNIASESETLSLGASAIGTLAAELTGIGQLQLSADLGPSDTVTLDRSNSTYDGEVVVNGGTLAVAHSEALGIGGFSFNRTLVDGTEATGKVALSGNTTVSDEVLTLEARENAGFDAVHLTSTGNNAWNGNIVGETGGTQYNIESTSGTLTLGGTITTPDSADREIVFSGNGNFSVARISDAARDADGNISGPSGDDTITVVKRGSGTLTITTGTDTANDYWVGSTRIEQGTLAVNAGSGDIGELQSHDVAVRSGATLNVSSFSEYSQQVGQTLRGSGTINVGSGTLALYDDGSLEPGDGTGQIGTLNVTGNASLSAFAAAGTEGTWSFDVGNDSDTSGDMLAVSGAFAATGSAALTVNVTPAHGHLDAGARTIVSHSGGVVSGVNGIAAQITDAAGNLLSPRQTVAVNGNTAGQINVVVTGEETSRTWKGNVSGAWDIGTSNNWQEGDQQFRDLDRVTFGDSATGTTDIAVDGSRFTSSVTFANSSKEYTLSGSGGIVGTGEVNVTGTGQVTLANTGNNFSGATTIASGASLRMTSANTGGITNAGTLSLGVPVTVEAFTQNATLSIGANNHKVFAVEAEDFVSSTVNNSDVVVWESLSDANASSGQALIATTTAENNLDTNLANQNYVTYGLKFTEPGEYYFYGRFRGEDDGDASTANDDSLWLPATDLGNGVTTPQAFSTKFDGDQFSSARNAEGATSGGDLFDFDWYISSGQNDGFDRIVVTPADVANGTVFQFGVATRESGGVFDKFVFVQDPDFATDANFGTITDADLDGVQVITTTSSETSLTAGNILDVNGDFTMSGDASILNLLVGTPDIHDQINVSGNFVADGVLNVQSVSGSVVAEVGDVFDIFTFDSVSGAFDDIVLPALSGGLHWETFNLLVTGELSVVGPAGDFDEDGDVDGNDFLVWQRDPSVGNLADWEANYGSGIGTAIASASVPEPCSFFLIYLGSMAAVLCWKRESASERMAGR